jgi:hypothetical protein
MISLKNTATALMCGFAAALAAFSTSQSSLAGGRTGGDLLLILDPAAGPCDADVRLTVTGGTPGVRYMSTILIPNAGGTLAELGGATADPDGRIVLDVSLGEAGCEAARLREQRKDVQEASDLGLRVFPVDQPARGAVADYAYTTLIAGEGLPAAGGGNAHASSSVWLKLSAAFILATGAGLVISGRVTR